MERHVELNQVLADGQAVGAGGAGAGAGVGAGQSSATPNGALDSLVQAETMPSKQVWDLAAGELVRRERLGGVVASSSSAVSEAETTRGGLSLDVVGAALGGLALCLVGAVRSIPNFASVKGILVLNKQTREELMDRASFRRYGPRAKALAKRVGQGNTF